MFERKKSAGKIYFLPIDQIHPSSWWQGSGGCAPASWPR